VTIPNALSLLRIFLLAPFLIAVIYRQYTVSLVIFVCAGISDVLDGYLARRLGQVTRLGAYLDPLGDRLLTTVSFVSLSIHGLLPAWLAVLVVAKDLYVALGAAILYFIGQPLVGDVSISGKLATFLQILTVAICLLAQTISVSMVIQQGFFVLTGVVTVFACLNYILQGLRPFADGQVDTSQTKDL
jgi:cardiolipin synthase